MPPSGVSRLLEYRNSILNLADIHLTSVSAMGQATVTLVRGYWAVHVQGVGLRLAWDMGKGQLHGSPSLFAAETKTELGR
jgi:hypothetical protein